MKRPSGRIFFKKFFSHTFLGKHKGRISPAAPVGDLENKILSCLHDKGNAKMSRKNLQSITLRCFWFSHRKKVAKRYLFDCNLPTLFAPLSLKEIIFKKGEKVTLVGAGREISRRVLKTLNSLLFSRPSHNNIRVLIAIDRSIIFCRMLACRRGHKLASFWVCKSRTSGVDLNATQLN